jgi:putative dehydrogenase
MRVAVAGLGSMGMGVARSMLRAGFDVCGCDVRDSALAEFRAAGGRATRSPAEAGKDAAAAVVLVVNAAQTEQVLFGGAGLTATLEPGAVILASATVAPAFAVALGARLAERGFLHLDAPVSGGPVKAAEGALTVMASGSPAAFEKAQPVLDAMAAKVYRLGEASGQGSTVKMINQLLAGVHIAAACEAMALGIRAGADPRTLYEVIGNSAGASWMFQNRVPHILEGDYSPRSAVNIFVKDLGIVLDVARAAAFPLPLTATAHQMFLTAVAAGYGHDDDASVVKIFPGVELPERSV